MRESHKDEDLKYNDDYAWGDWPDEVASRFANWLNSYLRDKKVTSVGDVEHKHWAKQAVLEGTSWPIPQQRRAIGRSEEHTSELQSRGHLVCRLLLEKKKKIR